MDSERGWFLQRAVDSIPWIMEQFNVHQGCFHPESWDERFHNPIYALAFLHQTDHPGNTYYRDELVLEAAIAGGDYYCQKQNQQGEWPHGSPNAYVLAEWAAYYLTETLVLLDGRIADAKTKRWREALARFAESAVRRPHSFTAPSNEAWKCMVLWRLGQVLDRKDWQRHASAQMRALNAAQRTDGYWEEPFHDHGPSPTYHHLHLAALAHYHRMSQDDSVLPALDRALDYAIAVSQPDGVPLACFDGRSAYTPFAFYASAFALSRRPEGRTLVQNACAAADAWTQGRVEYSASSEWAAFIQPCFLIDDFRYYEEGVHRPLPQETDGYRRQFHLAGVHRGDGWLTALSGLTSDAPLVSPHELAYERQSRIDIWHWAFGPIVGGGSQARSEDAPLANCVVSTNYKEVGVDFGVIRATGREEGVDPARIATAYYLPRAVDWVEEEKGLAVRQWYGHGSVLVRITPVRGDELQVEFTPSLTGVKQVCFQLPLVLAFDARVWVDDELGSPIATDETQKLTYRVQKEVRLQRRPLRDVDIVISRPLDTQCRLHYPIHAGLGLVGDRAFSPAYVVGLLSAMPGDPERDRPVRFVVRTVAPRVEDAD